MSKLKSDIIRKKYKENYLCKMGHNILWEGANLLGSNLECNKCGRKEKTRWSCSICKSFFCIYCFNLIIEKYCPKKHKYKFYKQNEVDYFSSFFCDCCFENLLTKDGLLYDKECDITICLNCFCNCCDIPDVLED